MPPKQQKEAKTKGFDPGQYDYDNEDALLVDLLNREQQLKELENSRQKDTIESNIRASQGQYVVQQQYVQPQQTYINTGNLRSSTGTTQVSYQQPVVHSQVSQPTVYTQSQNMNAMRNSSGGHDYMYQERPDQTRTVIVDQQPVITSSQVRYIEQPQTVQYVQQPQVMGSQVQYVNQQQQVQYIEQPNIVSSQVRYIEQPYSQNQVTYVQSQPQTYMTSSEYIPSNTMNRQI